MNIRSITIMAIALFLLSAIVIQQTQFTDLMAASLSRKVVPLTELYFENHTNLPKSVELNKDYSFQFSIHNLEGRATTYEYEVLLDSLELDSGRILLDPNKKRTINVNLQFLKTFVRGYLEVALVDRSEKIGFWVDETI